MRQDDQARYALFRRLEEVLGVDHAATLMGTLPPMDWSELATKADLERFATKADLERFAIKADLERFAIKADLERFATKADLERFATKADLERFPTKDHVDVALEDRFARLWRRVVLVTVGTGAVNLLVTLWAVTIAAG